MPTHIQGVLIWIVIFIIGYAAGRAGAKGSSPTRPMVAWKPDATITDADIEAEVRAGRYVEAIKLHRRRYGSGLKDAKQAIDAMSANMKAGRR